jgi:hypothetical protein
MRKNISNRGQSHMKPVAKKLATAAVTASLLLAASGPGFAATEPLSSIGSGAHAYPAAGGQVGGQKLQVLGKGTTAVLRVSGNSKLSGGLLVGKLLSVSVKTPSGKVIQVGTARTDSQGNYQFDIKNVATKPGVYKVTVTYRGRSSTVSITVKK